MPDLAVLWVDIDLIEPNPWNPNRMSDDMLEKEIESVHRFGFIDPVTCRRLGDVFQLIDGEHRWSVAKSHSGACVSDGKGGYTDHVGMRQLPVSDLGVVEDHIAKQMTIVLNETRGEAEPKKMGLVLIDLIAAEPLPLLTKVLPFTQDQISEMAELPRVDWNKLEGSQPKKRDGSWVERVYRLPKDVATTLDEAIKAAKEEGAESDVEAIRKIAEEFLE